MSRHAIGSSDLLAAIVGATRRIVEARARKVPIDELERRAYQRSPIAGAFRGALTASGKLNVIAECKRRSPSRGILRPHYDAAAIARGYESAGAAAVSVLTEPTFFDGSLDDLMAVRQAISIPILRKDFIVDRYQILEARAAGADAILLIAAALEVRELSALRAKANEAGLDVLVEVHQAEELHAAIAAGASIIGVNNRDLRTLEVDQRTSERLLLLMPPGVVAVAESGLKTTEDLRRLHGLGYHAFLVGERLMTSEDPGKALEELLR